MAIAVIDYNDFEMIFSDDILRPDVALESFFHFCMFYMQDRFELEPADFHKDILNSLDSIDDMDRYLAIIGFRGSAKSTILEVFAIWSMLNGNHNFIVYIGATIDDAEMALANIRDEIEQNDMLRKDFGIELEDSSTGGFREKWSEKQMTIGNCTIIAKSKGSKIRGVKFKKARIDLIIGDDLEDVQDAKTKEKRKKTRSWFFTEVLPATKQGVQDTHVKVVLIGNLVHRDCLIANLSKGDIVKVHRFPLIDENGEITWKGLYPDMEAVEKEKAKVMLAGEGLGHVIWAREYLLKSVDEEDMVLKLEDIQYYPDEWLQRKPVAAGVGVDFAISEEETADYTAFVKGFDVRNDDGERKMCIGRNNLERRMGFEKTIRAAVEINELMPHGTIFYPEKVAYQQAAIEIMEKNGITCKPQSATGDKKARITAACFYVKSGRVLFPKFGAENVIENLIGFGIEDHDDLADAFAHMILAMVKKSGSIILG